MRQQHAFLETERVDRPESAGGDGGVAKPQLGLHAISHRGIDVSEPRAKLIGRAPEPPLPHPSSSALGRRREPKVARR